MCDTFVALGNSTVDGSVIFGKNTDREPNEAHEVQILPAQDYPPGSSVQCTYIQIPQQAHTHAVLLAKPFWMWGAEMGVNEHGVAIGNEAIFTKVPYEKGPALTGMDLLRLGLERGASALEALQVITQLLETYGQGGNCGFTHPFYYHNSFIIADPREAWVLETAGAQWVAEKVENIRSISNGASIGSQWDLSSADLVRYAVDHGWCKSRDDFHFARCYSDFLYTTLSASGSRAVCTTDLLKSRRGHFHVRDAFNMLRSHDGKATGDVRLDGSLLGAYVCMHAGAGPVRESQSVGSLVAHLDGDLHTIWVTATSAPCLSVFKPTWIDSCFPLAESAPQGTYSPDHLWWRHELFHRAVLQDYSHLAPLVEREREELEKSFLDAALSCPNDSAARRVFSADCFARAETSLEKWQNRVQAERPARRNSFYYTMAWNVFNRNAKLKP